MFNDRKILTDITPEHTESRSLYHMGKASVTEYSGVRAIIQMDKEVYLPFDEMHIRVALVHAENGTLLPIHSYHAILLKIVYPDKHEYPLHAFLAHDGVYSATFQICNYQIGL